MEPIVRRFNSGAPLRVHLVGTWTDQNGVWDCYTPTGMAESVYYRLEHQQHQFKFRLIYAPAGLECLAARSNAVYEGVSLT